MAVTRTTTYVPPSVPVWREGGGYSPGKSRKKPLTYSEAEALFATARDKELGKPLPGGVAMRLQKDENVFQIGYRGSVVVSILPDGTYLLTDAGYPTRVTALKMSDYSPARVLAYGKRSRSREGHYEWESLAIFFIPSDDWPPGRMPDLYDAFLRPERHCWLPFPRGRLRVDSEGLPVLSDLLSEIAPPAWKRLADRVQPWTDPQTPSTPVPLSMLDKIAISPGRKYQPLLLRRRWAYNDPIASIWVEGPRPPVFRWMVLDRSGEVADSGTSSRLELAVSSSDRAIRRSGWVSKSPLLGEVLVADVYDSSIEALANEPVMGVHWMEPWVTRSLWGEDPEADFSWANIPLESERRPLPGSLPWPGSPEGRKSNIREWFELSRGRAVGIAADKGRSVAVLHQGEESIGSRGNDSAIALGLVAAVMARLSGIGGAASGALMLLPP